MRQPRSPLSRFALVAGLAAFSFATAALADPPVRVPLDGETTLGGVDVACTGIGQTKDQPKWLAYPVRVEFADAQRAYLAGEIVTVTSPGGEDLLTVSCEGPWVLLKLPKGQAYKVQAQLTEDGVAPRGTVVKAPAHGQARFVITFPDAH
jgi:hypothetical protein